MHKALELRFDKDVVIFRHRHKDVVLGTVDNKLRTSEDERLSCASIYKHKSF